MWKMPRKWITWMSRMSVWGCRLVYKPSQQWKLQILGSYQWIQMKFWPIISIIPDHICVNFQTHRSINRRVMQIFADMIINRTNSVTWSLMQSDLMVQSCNSRSWWNGRTEHLDNKWLHLLWPRLSNYVNSSNLIRQGQEPSAKMMCLQVKIFGFFCSKQQKATHKVKRFPSTIVGNFGHFFSSQNDFSGCFTVKESHEITNIIWVYYGNNNFIFLNCLELLVCTTNKFLHMSLNN